MNKLFNEFVNVVKTQNIIIEGLIFVGRTKKGYVSFGTALDELSRLTIINEARKINIEHDQNLQEEVAVRRTNKTKDKKKEVNYV